MTVSPDALADERHANDSAMPTTMRAAVLGARNELKIVTKPVPEVSADEALVRVERASMCGTDLKIRSHKFFAGRAPAPGTFTPGHEYAGTVVRVGAAVDEFAPGDRVVSESHRGCMRCTPCLHGEYTNCVNYGRVDKGHRAMGMTVNGGFADYVVNHVTTLHKVPESISFDEAAALTTAGTSMHALSVIRTPLVGASVVVIGAGAVGLLTAQLCKQLGARLVAVLGSRPARLALAASYGADVVVDARAENALARVRSAVGEAGAGFVFECSGSTEAVDQAIEISSRSGVIVLVGFFDKPVTADLNVAVMNGLTLHTIRGEGADAVPRSVELAAQGRLRTAELITHHFPLEGINEAFDTYAERRGDAIKVMLDIGSGT